METEEFMKMVEEQIELAVRNRDRSITVFVSPDGSFTASVYPWPEPEENV